MRSRLSRMARPVLRFLRDEGGPTAVEYALLLALIFVVCVSVIQALGGKASNTFSYVGTTTKAKAKGS